MEKFKKGDKFIPRKPKVNKRIMWNNSMDIYNGKVLTVDYITVAGNIKPKEGICLFHPDWCEKVDSAHPIDEGVGDLRSVLNEINLCINLKGTATEGELKSIWNTISNAINKIEDCEKVGNSEIPNDHIPDVGKVIDWDYWRNEFAKSVMQGIFGDNNFLSTIVNKAETYKTDYKVLLCSTAIDIANEMIKQLKQE